MFLLAFELGDGTRVSLCDDTNFTRGERHAETIAARVRKFVEQAPAARAD